MGFSVSGATAVILVGGLIAFSFAFTAASNGYEQIADAREEHQNSVLAQQNTAIEVTNATYDSGAGELTVNATNEGSTELEVADTSLLVDGEYVQPSALNASVEGDSSTALWLPGETLTFVVDVASQPGRVKVVTETGVADTTTEVTASG